MKFRALAKLEVWCFAGAYAPVGIGMAWLGAGPWSLVGAHLAQSAFRTVV